MLESLPLRRAKRLNLPASCRGAFRSAALLLLWALPAEAYVGPGAGFAILSSFLAVLLAFLYSAVAIVTWPFRKLRRWRKRRWAYRKAQVRRVIIVGFDGMDPELVARFMDEGKLPHLARLREAGTFFPLATTCPPISPVAWSTFQTGVNPGKHNIYDFIAPDRATYRPFLSSALIRGPQRRLRLGNFMVPVGRPKLKMLRKARPFWHYLGDAGIESSVIRVPITFPPEKFPGVLLAGMCVPDLRGSQGTFSFHTTRQFVAGFEHGGDCLRLERRDGAWWSYIPGMDNPLVENGPAVRVPFRVVTEPWRGRISIKIQQHRIEIALGEYSDWVELDFKVGLGIRARGICRFYLKQLAPDLEIYATPVNIHPGKPALPISHPFTYSIYLAKLLGPYATLGLAEDTSAMNESILDADAFLRQCWLIHEERERMFFDALDKRPSGVTACVFDITDRVQHMFWRCLRSGNSRVIEDLYRRMDDLVGRTLERTGPSNDTLVLVLSDHGFKSFERAVNLNTWLRESGYLVLNDESNAGGEWFTGVDWRRTRAYAFGLNGVFINQAGREGEGIVANGAESAALQQELCEALRGLRDSETGRVAIRDAYPSGAVFRGPYAENAPDVIVGYNEGYRVSWASATGKVTSQVFEDNRRAWSGDHCIDPHLVPGVLFSNRRLRCENPAIVDIAPTVLELFGLRPPPHFEGRAWTLD